jgi:hypothetical protein
MCRCVSTPAEMSATALFNFDVEQCYDPMFPTLGRTAIGVQHHPLTWCQL